MPNQGIRPRRERNEYLIQMQGVIRSCLEWTIKKATVIDENKKDDKLARVMTIVELTLHKDMEDHAIMVNEWSFDIHLGFSIVSESFVHINLGTGKRSEVYLLTLVRRRANSRNLHVMSTTWMNTKKATDTTPPHGWTSFGGSTTESIELKITWSSTAAEDEEHSYWAVPEMPGCFVSEDFSEVVVRLNSKKSLKLSGYAFACENPRLKYNRDIVVHNDLLAFTADAARA